jgi:hypothetical protein
VILQAKNSVTKRTAQVGDRGAKYEARVVERQYELRLRHPPTIEIGDWPNHRSLFPDGKS